MRPEKKSIVSEIRGSLEKSEYVFLADYRGLTVVQLSELRARLREADVCFQVVKNDFLRIAAQELGWDNVADFFGGPIAMIVGSSDVILSAKILVEFKNKNNLPLIKGGRMGDRSILAVDIEEMSNIPSREVLLSQLVGVVCAPLSGVVGVMNQKLLSLLYVLRAAEEKKEK
ncbi:50S ribosomal protein L10 [Verrucomicrobiota bacterium]